MWNIDLKHDEEAKIVNFGCKIRDENVCAAFEKHLKTDFRSSVLDFEKEHIFNSPTA